MRIKGIVDENFINYKVPSMEIITSFCTFKCDKESGQQVCQNSALASAPIKNISCRRLIERYLDNPITKAVCFAGLEPIEQINEIIYIISTLRLNYRCDDYVIIYTGYNEDEITKELGMLRHFKNVIVKFGRFVPNSQRKYDEVLGVMLASDNQYARVIS